MSEHTLVAFTNDMDDKGHACHEIATAQEMVDKLPALEEIITDPNFKNLYYTVGHWTVDVCVVRQEKHDMSGA